MMRMMRFSECYEEIEYRRGKVIRRRRGSSGNVRLSHLLIWVSCLNKCCEPKQRFLHVWHGIDHQIIIDNAVDEWRGRLRACAGKRRTLRATIVTIFSHMRRDVSVLCQQFLDSFFWKLPQIRTSKFRKEVRQHTEGMMVHIIWVLLEIYFSFQQWKNFKNPLTKLSPWVWCTAFWDTVYNRHCWRELTFNSFIFV